MHPPHQQAPQRHFHHEHWQAATRPAEVRATEITQADSVEAFDIQCREALLTLSTRIDFMPLHKEEKSSS